MKYTKFFTILIIAMLSITSVCNAQTDSVEQKYMRVEVMPQYPGGNAALLKFIAEHVEYPKQAVDENIQGTVVVKFVITKQGKAQEAEIIRSVHPILDSAALEVIPKLKEFTPGIQDGKYVHVYFTLPISFKLADNSQKKKKK